MPNQPHLTQNWWFSPCPSQQKENDVYSYLDIKLNLELTCPKVEWPNHITFSDWYNTRIKVLVRSCFTTTFWNIMRIKSYMRFHSTTSAWNCRFIDCYITLSYLKEDMWIVSFWPLNSLLVIKNWQNWHIILTLRPTQ